MKYANYKISKAMDTLGYDGSNCHAFYANKYSYSHNLFTESKLYESINHNDTTSIKRVCKEFSAPTYEEVIDFFEDKYKIKITSEHQNITGMWYCYIWEFIETKWIRKKYIIQSFQYKHEAHKAAIEYLLKEHFNIKI